MTARIKVHRRRWAVRPGYLPGWRSICTECWQGCSADSQQDALAVGLAHLAVAHPEQAADPPEPNASQSGAEGPGGSPGTPGRPQTQPWHRQQMLPDPIQTKETTP